MRTVLVWKAQCQIAPKNRSSKKYNPKKRWGFCDLMGRALITKSPFQQGQREGLLRSMTACQTLVSTMNLFNWVQRNCGHGATINFFKQYPQRCSASNHFCNHLKHLLSLTCSTFVLKDAGRKESCPLLVETNTDKWPSLWWTQGHQQWTCLSNLAEQKSGKTGWKNSWTWRSKQRRG